MISHHNRSTFVGLFFALFLSFQFTYAQCLMRPVSLEQRSTEAAHIVLGKLLSQESYWDAQHRNIYTLNIIEVEAWLKGYQPEQRVGVITLGGFVGDKGQISHPSLELAPYNEYVLMLNADNHLVDDRAMRLTDPNLLQMEPFASSQGAMTKQSGVYHDLLSEQPQNEASLFAKIAQFTGETPKTSHGDVFEPREGDTHPLYEWASAQNRLLPITSFTPTNTPAGTIVTTDFVTITGSGFGAAAGTVFYSNADDGGATFTSSGVSTDNVAWSATSIQNKVARGAGTGPININGAMTSGTNLTIPYSHININSTFNGFGSATRQRYYLVNKNGTGGYTFTYNTAFNTNAPAVASFERALATWRCATFVNFTVNKSSTSAVATAALDGLNLVLFDGSLPVGVLGLATSRFNGSAIASCTGVNTIWWTDEIDVQFFPDPPTAGFPWQYGPTAPSFTNYDFESVAVHELGHGHGLGHVISAGAVMHFALANGQNSRSLSVNDITGGTVKMSYSTLPLCFTPATVSGPMIALTPGTCILPVTFLSFTGHEVLGEGNVLDWSLSQEVQNGRFEIERSLDGNAFMQIGQVTGMGNSQVTTSYRFVDQQPVHGILNYYRLRQVDQNGSASYSQTVAILSTDGPGIKVIPTLVQDRLRVLGDGNGSTDLQIALYDLRGALVFTHALPSGPIDLQIDMQACAQGMYFFKVRSASGVLLAGKVIKE